MINIIIIRIVIIVITLSTIFFILLLDTNTAFAFEQTSNYCADLKDKQGTHGIASRYNGNTCDTPGHWNDNKTCLGARGGRYMAYFCNPIAETLRDPDKDYSQIGCEDEFPEPGPNAPAFCNRPDTGVQTDISTIFGEILPPQAIQNFGFGSLGISKFLSNLIVLIYSIATIVFIFMLIWGAFEWLTSGGDKEKVAAARARLTYAIIGIILFAVAFAVIRVLGAFTGFTFFKGQIP